MRRRKVVEEKTHRAGTGEQRLSEKAWLRKLQIASAWTGAKLRSTLSFVTSDVATVIVSDVRRGLRAVGRGVARVVNPALNAFEAVYNRFAGFYPPLLTAALDNKGLVIASAVGLLGFAGYISTFLGAELIPSLTQGEFSFEVRLPQGRALHHTDRVMQDLEKEVAGWSAVRSVYSSVGGSNKNQFARESHEENVGQLYVVMRDKTDKIAEADTVRRIRERLSRSAEITYTFQRPTLFSVKTPVEVEIFAYDLDVQRRTADVMAERMRRIAGLSDVRTSTELGNPEIQVRFDREKLARLGLDEAQVANVVRSKIRGDVASRFREDDKQIEIVVRASENQRNTVESVGSLLINLGAAVGASAPRPDGSPGDGPQQQAAAVTTQSQPRPGGTAAVPTVPISLASIANITIDRGPAEVRRVRSQRAAVVSANLSGRDLSSVSNDLRAQIRELSTQIPPEVSISLGGQNEELNTSYRSLMFALGLAVFLVYLVMASEFESLIHPFVILFSVPFGLVGVVFALAITGTTISVMVLLGVIILVGIVVNNAIVLIDYANQLRGEGYARRDALRMAGEVRLRPILMTTMTSALGLVPMALGWGEGAEIRSPMAIAVIGGMTFSTALTLIFIPVMYEVLDRRGHVARETIPETSDGTSMAPAPAGD